MRHIKFYSIILILNVSIFHSCKKDDESTASLENEYRLTEWKYYVNNAVQNRSVLTYDTDRLTEINYYDMSSDKGTQELKRRIAFSYNGENVEVNDYDVTPAGHQLMAMEKRKFSGNDLTELREYISDMSNPDFISSFEYSGDKLSTKIFQDHVNSKNITSVYSWKDNKIKSIKSTTNHNTTTIIEDVVFTYNGGDISTIISYINGNTWFDTTKTSFTYNDDIVSMKFFFKNWGNWDLDREQTFVLDDFGNTIRIYDGDISAPMIMEYFYERNNGNFTKVFLTPDFSFSGLLYPFKK